jgi:hypothetical protein
MKSRVLIVSVVVGYAASVSYSRDAAQEGAAPSNTGFRIDQVCALKPGAFRKDLLRLLPTGAKHIPGFASLNQASEFYIVSNRWEVAYEFNEATDRLLRAPVVTDMGDNAERATHTDRLGMATIRWLGPNDATTNLRHGEQRAAPNPA